MQNRDNLQANFWMEQTEGSSRGFSFPVPAVFVFALALSATQLLGNAFYFSTENVSTFWPTSGLVVAVLLLTKLRCWPVVMATLIAVQAVTELTIFDRSFDYVLAFLLPICTETLLAAGTLRFLLKRSFRIWDNRHFFHFLIVAVLGSTLVGSLMGATIVKSFFPAVSYWQVWRIWWLADALGVLITAPAILAWFEYPKYRAVFYQRNENRRIEIAIWSLCFIVAATTSLIVRVGAPTATSASPFLFLPTAILVVPFFIWAAFRFNLRVVVTGLLVYSCMLVGITVSGDGPFIQTGLSSNEVVLALQAFLALVMITMIILSNQVELARRKSIELREQKSFLETIIENIPANVTMTDADGHYIFVNQGSADQTKNHIAHSPEGFVGKTSEEIFDTGKAEIFNEYTRQVIETGEPLVDIERKDHADGDKINLFDFIPIKGPAGKVENVLTLSYDITERKRVEDALRTSEERLHQAHKMEVLGQMTGSIAHDFNNILTVLGCNIGLLKSLNCGEGQQLNGLINDCQEAIAMGSSQISRLTNFARKAPVAETRFDLNTMIAGFGDLLKRSVGKHVSLEFILTDTALPVLADAVHLEVALLNLALNAKDAMPEGGKITIRTDKTIIDKPGGPLHSTDAQRPYAVLQISDTGIGMPPEIKERAFEAFFTTKDEGKGTGLGLSTVQDVTQGSGGFVQIESEPKKGTTVKIHLPLHESDSRDDLRP